VEVTLQYSSDKWVTVMDGVTFEFNDIKSLYTKDESEQRWSAYNNIIRKIFDDIIVIKVIYFPIRQDKSLCSTVVTSKSL